MTKTRQRMESCFTSLARTVTRYRLMALLLALTVACTLVSRIPQLHMDMSTQGFLHEDDPQRILYQKFRDQFGNDDVVVIAVETEDPFAPAFLGQLKSLHEALERRVPYLDEVKSLLNARNTFGREDELLVEDLLRGWPDEKRDLKEVRRRALATPLYRNLYLNDAASIATIVVKPVTTPSGQTDALAGFDEPGVAAAAAGRSQQLTTAQSGEIMAAVNAVVAEYAAQGLAVHVAGWPAVENALVSIMKRDSVRFMLLSLAVCSVLLLTLFRRFSPVLLALGTVILSLLSTLGLMAWLDIPYKIPSQVLPAFLIVVGIGDSVHILSIFHQQLRKGVPKTDAIVAALGHSGLPILLTSLTTAGGLLSFFGGDNAPLSDLGLYASSGVMLALFFSVVFLPAMLALIPAPRPKAVRRTTRLDRTFVRLAGFCTGNARTVVAGALLVALVMAYGAMQAGYSHFPTRWLPRDMRERQATEFVDRNMAGSRNLEMIVDTHRRQGLYDPAVLQALDRLGRDLEARYPQRPDGIYVGKTLSLGDILKEINQALNANRSKAYRIPDDPALIPQEFLLFETSGTDDLEDFVDTAFSKARFTIKVPDMDCTSYTDFIDEVEALFRSRLGPDITVRATGNVGLTSRILAAVKQTQISSLLIATLVIGLLMVLFMGNIRIGLLSMVPNMFPILVGVGSMGLLGIPFDNATAMVAAITLGIAADDTIHFMHTFKRYYDDSGEARGSVRQAFAITGRAMLFTSLILVAGFMSYTFATLGAYVMFGLLLSITIVVALAADFLLAPALLELILGGTRKAEAANNDKEGATQCA